MCVGFWNDGIGSNVEFIFFHSIRVPSLSLDSVRRIEHLQNCKTWPFSFHPGSTIAQFLIQFHQFHLPIHGDGLGRQHGTVRYKSNLTWKLPSPVKDTKKQRQAGRDLERISFRLFVVGRWVTARVGRWMEWIRKSCGAAKRTCCWMGRKHKKLPPAWGVPSAKRNSCFRLLISLRSICQLLAVRWS